MCIRERHLPGIGIYRHYGGRPQSAFYRQAEGQPHNEGACLLYTSEDAKRHNVVFVGRDRSGTPRYAHVRGTADPFRQDITGSDKSYPFRYEGNGNQLFVFEAPIDLLSFICLYPQDWQTRNYLALGGVSGKALDCFLSERKDTRKVFLCLDSDTAGSEACFRLAQDIPSEIAVVRLVPARKDWNDVLRQQGEDVYKRQALPYPPHRAERQMGTKATPGV